MKRIMLLVLLTLLSHQAWSQRLAVLAPNLVEMVFDLGHGGDIVATSAYADYPEAAKKIPRVSQYNQLNLEKLLALKPDLVIAWQDGIRPADVAKIKQFGIPVEVFAFGPWQDIPKAYRRLGTLLGAEDQAQIWEKKFQQAFSQAKETYGQKQKLKVFYQVWDKPLMTFNNDHWVSQMITACGGENIFAHAKAKVPQVSLEAVYARKPQVLMAATSKAMQPKWQAQWQKWLVPAAQQKAFVFLEADWVSRPSGRLLKGLQQMCQKLDKFRSLVSSKP